MVLVSQSGWREDYFTTEIDEITSDEQAMDSASKIDCLMKESSQVKTDVNRIVHKYVERETDVAFVGRGNNQTIGMAVSSLGSLSVLPRQEDSRRQV